MGRGRGLEVSAIACDEGGGAKGISDKLWVGGGAKGTSGKLWVGGGA